ncbi:6-phosphogluconolactonase [Silvibacterium dinghuense]|uniref:6-phosphogluconolactonase n=1 Tax=Silvibacterium dinghuense TaxID=1560006 RepID=A0A4Q1S9J8_9BACT|nr:6-phosphogluconolactonase [Silvibacterium dinghuense]RXS93720.1 6-phosphogluconolactonase [Silvibacterium dinghuense]GGH07115.1 6-phosphogluconolactonase [Silvibacterium dinghuense]
MAKTTQVEYRVYEGAAELSRAAAEHFLESIQAAVAARGRARVAISGGSTPKRTFELLANASERYEKEMPWDKIELFFVDERTVPPTDKDSNYRMTKETLLEHVPLKPEQVHRMEGELNPEEAAARYESTIRNQFKLEGAETPVFDVLALGMGDDAHTASLFPHTEAIHELAKIVTANHVPQKDTWRITLTWPVINAARDVFFLIGGKDKTEPLHMVLLGEYDVETYPSQLIQPKSGKLLMLLDKDAAAKLPAVGADGVGRLEVTR